MGRLNGEFIFSVGLCHCFSLVDIVLCEFNVAYLKNENNIGCLSGLDPKGNLYICQKEKERKYIIETFTKPNLKRKVYKV